MVYYVIPVYQNTPHEIGIYLTNSICTHKWDISLVVVVGATRNVTVHVSFAGNQFKV